jgi:hypothetical protein
MQLVLHNHPRFNIILIRRTSGQSLGTFEKSNALSDFGGALDRKSILMQYSCFKLCINYPLPITRPSSFPQISALPHCLLLPEGYKGRCKTLQSRKFSFYPSSSITKLVQLNTAPIIIIIIIILLLLLLLFRDLFVL